MYLVPQNQFTHYQFCDVPYTSQIWWIHNWLSTEIWVSWLSIWKMSYTVIAFSHCHDPLMQNNVIYKICVMCCWLPFLCLGLSTFSRNKSTASPTSFLPCGTARARSVGQGLYDCLNSHRYSHWMCSSDVQGVWFFFFGQCRFFINCLHCQAPVVFELNLRPGGNSTLLQLKSHWN